MRVIVNLIQSSGGLAGAGRTTFGFCCCIYIYISGQNLYLLIYVYLKIFKSKHSLHGDSTTRIYNHRGRCNINFSIITISIIECNIKVVINREISRNISRNRRIVIFPYFLAGKINLERMSLLPLHQSGC